MAYKIYVLGDNISTDDILPGAYITINPATSKGFKDLGDVCFSGLPPKSPPFLNLGYTCIVAGENFGCGSSREHAVIALKAANIQIILAKSFARIFFRNCIATGAILPLTCPNLDKLKLQNGQAIKIDLQNSKLIIGDLEEDIAKVGELANIVKAGGMFAYAREIGKIKNNTIPNKQI